MCMPGLVEVKGGLVYDVGLAPGQGVHADVLIVLSNLSLGATLMSLTP